jgi:hypothetical protein
MRNRPCFECGVEAVEDHHVVPRVLGGTHTVPLCGACHGKAHAMERGDHRRLTLLGLQLARERGVKIGRPGLPVETIELVIAAFSRVPRPTLRAVAAEVGVSLGTASTIFRDMRRTKPRRTECST